MSMIDLSSDHWPPTTDKKHMTFYLKYRPQTIEELDMYHVRESLMKIVGSGDIPHAFLFAGPKGTGKTSAARILAKVINCEDPPEKGVPCNKCKMCTSITKGENIDVIELDAASHRGIDDIRLLRDAVKLAPAAANKKIYIIDEAHMLTPEASNALLKTLEEPPEHVVFIMATTNPEKLLGTVRSRTTTIQFQKASEDEIMSSLQKVVDAEKIKTDSQSLKIIAEVSDGSFRDAQKLLEQLSTEMKELEKEKVKEFLYGKGSYDITRFIDLLISRNAEEALKVIEKIAFSASVEHYIEKLITRLREALLAEYTDNKKDIKGLTVDEISKLIRLFSKAHSEIRFSPIEQLPVELAVVDWCGDPPNLTENEENGIDNKNKSENSAGSKINTSDTKQGNSKSTNNSKKKNGAVNTSSADRIVDDQLWVELLAQVRSRNVSTEALLRAARPIDYDGKIFKIGVYYQFHKEKLEGAPHRELLENILENIFDSDVRVNCTLTEPPRKSKPEPQDEVVLTESNDEDIIKVAEEIFGA